MGPYVLSLLIAAGLALIVAFWGGLGEPKGKEKLRFMAGLFVIFFIIFAIFGLFLTAAALHAPQYEERTFTTDTRIYSLRTESSLSGSFFLGCGSIEGTLSYIYYADAGNGGMLLKTIPSAGVVIYQDEADNPYLRTFTTSDVNVKTGEREYSIFDLKQHEIHIPPGSVIQEYKP